MSKLQAALAWARRGFEVFPLAPNTRVPAFGEDWRPLATADEAKIRAMWTDQATGYEYDYNIGCSCDDLVVIDLDVKKGKHGVERYREMGGEWNTLTVRTTSGGYHLYFLGPTSSNAPLHKDGVDVRSWHGYVVAPGSVIDGSPYVVSNDTDIKWIPSHIEKMLKSPYEKSEVDTSHLAQDTEARVNQAVGYLQSCPPAIEGQRGNETTFVTACHILRDIGLTPTTAYGLLRDVYNPRCYPAWSEDELWAMIENAGRYGSIDTATQSPEFLFAATAGLVAEAPSPMAQFQFGNAVDPSRIPRRQWVIDRALMVGAVTVLLAAGSAGKSTLSLAIAAHLALGMDFAGMKTEAPKKSIVYNGEDDLVEQSRRLAAICNAYSLDYNIVRKNILLLSPRELKLTLVLQAGHNPIRNDVVINALMEKARGNNVGMIVLDPLVKIHQCDENDNVQMDFVMDTLTDIAHHSGVALLLLHHVTKGGSQTQESRVGNMDISRGASSVVSAARVAFTLLNASQQDAEEYGIKDEERHMWVRLDDAKMNFNLANGNATWFQRRGCTIPSGDAVGVLQYVEKVKDKNHMRASIASVLAGHMMANNTGSLPLDQAANIIKEVEPLLRNKTTHELRGKLAGFMVPYVLDGGKTISYVRDGDKPIIRLT